MDWLVMYDVAVALANVAVWWAWWAARMQRERIFRRLERERLGSAGLDRTEWVYRVAGEGGLAGNSGCWSVLHGQLRRAPRYEVVESLGHRPERTLRALRRTSRRALRDSENGWRWRVVRLDTSGPTE